MNNNLRRPPGPKSTFAGLFLVRDLKRDLLGFYERMQRDYGDAVYMKIGPYHDYTFFHPDQVHEVLSTKAKSFIRMRRSMDVFRQWNGNSVLISEGDDWLRQRRIVQPAFSPKRFEAAVQEMNRAIGKFIDSLPAGDSTLDVTRSVTEMTTDVITRTMFGADLGHELAELRLAVRVLADCAFREVMQPFSLPLWVPLPGVQRKRRAIQLLRSIAERFIRDRRSTGEDRGDLLSMLLTAITEDDVRHSLSDSEVCDNCVTILLAGHDTTASALMWLCWYMASRPDIAQRARDEVQMVLGDRLPTYQDFDRLTYIQAMIREVLRHRPPAIGVFTRETIEDVEIGGYTVPRGSLVHLFSWNVHHDERWYRDPQVFDPERFLPPRVDEIRPCAYFPFGLGPRTCAGNNFAMVEMAVFTAMTLQRVELSLLAGQREPIPLAGVSLQPAGGLSLHCRKLR